MLGEIPQSILCPTIQPAYTKTSDIMSECFQLAGRVQKRRSSLVARAEKDGFEDLKKKLIDSGKAPIENELPGEGAFS